MIKKIKLPNVTLLAASSVEIDHTQDSLKISSFEIEFASIKLLSSEKPKIHFPEIEHVKIPKIDITKNMIKNFLKKDFFFIFLLFFKNYNF